MPKVEPLDYRVERARRRLKQSEFWEPLGVTQSCGSRYEKCNRTVPPAVAALAHVIYVMGVQIDARDFA